MLLFLSKVFRRLTLAGARKLVDAAEGGSKPPAACLASFRPGPKKSRANEPPSTMWGSVACVPFQRGLSIGRLTGICGSGSIRPLNCMQDGLSCARLGHGTRTDFEGST